MNIVTDDAEVAAALEASGVHVRWVREFRRHDVPTGSAVLVDSAHGWDRLRAWRIAGWNVPCVILGPSDPPGDRPRLEPVVAVAQPHSVPTALAWLDRGRPMSRLDFSDGSVSFEHRTVTGPQRTVTVSELQVTILAYLAARSSRPVPTEELLRQVWGYAPQVRSNAHAMAISRLRKLLQRAGVTGLSIESSRNFGYRLRVEPIENASLIGRGELLTDWRRAWLERGRLKIYGPPGCGKSALGGEVASSDVTRWVPVGPLLTTLSSTLDGRLLPDDTLASFVARITVPCDALVFDDCDALADTEIDALITLFDAHHPSTKLMFIRVRNFPDGDAVPPLGPDYGRQLFERESGLEASDGLLQHFRGSPAIIRLAAKRAQRLGIPALLSSLDTRAHPGASLAQQALTALGDAAAHAWRVFSLVDAALPIEQLTDLLGPIAFDHVETFVSWGLAELVDGRMCGNPVAVALGRDQQTPTATEQTADWLVERARKLEGVLEGRVTEAAIRELSRLRDAFLRVAENCDDRRWLGLMRAAEAHDRYRGDWSTREARSRTALQRLEDSPLCGEAHLLAARVHHGRNPARSAELAAFARPRLEDPEDAGTAALCHVHQTWVSEGPKAGLKLMDTLSTSPFPPRIRLRLRSIQIYLSHLVGGMSAADFIDHSGEVARSLAALGAHMMAARVAATLVFPAGKSRREDGVYWAKTGLDWLGDHPDGFIRILLTVNLAQIIGEPAEARRLFDDAFARVDRIEPSRRSFVEGAWSSFLIDQGEFETARPYLEHAVSRERERGSSIAIVSTLLDLATLELLAGRLEHAKTLTQRMRTVDFPDMAEPFVRLHEATLMAMDGEWAQAADHIESTRPPGGVGRSRDLRLAVFAWMRDRTERDPEPEPHPDEPGRARAWLAYVKTGQDRPEVRPELMDRLNACVCDRARE